MSSDMKGNILTTIGVLWFLALAYLVYWVLGHSRYGIGFELPFPATARRIGSFLMFLIIISGWLPTLAVGIYRMVHNR